jgi:hypothetical protein
MLRQVSLRWLIKISPLMSHGTGFGFGFLFATIGSRWWHRQVLPCFIKMISSHLSEVAQASFHRACNDGFFELLADSIKYIHFLITRTVRFNKRLDTIGMTSNIAYITLIAFS